ncbi:MAG: hypothetical protein KGK16_09775, partial [Bradyrhizobium sp.]|nr:hypothetical protein [Bradyrhizobium sp.]
MNSRVSWSVDGIDPSVRERAEAAAHRAGMTLNDWLNSTLGEPAPPDSRGAPQRPATQVPPEQTSDVADIHQRLDSITRQIEQISRPASRHDARYGAANGPGVAHQLNDAISRLDARLAQILNPASRNAELQDRQRQSEMVERAAAQVYTSQVYSPSPPISPASFDAAIAEIAARQNELDDAAPWPMSPRSAAPLAPAIPVAPMPMPATPDFSSLEHHLLQITSQIEALRRPDGIEQSIALFRSELAEIRAAITEAMPRRAIESIEGEIRSLSRRIDDTRQNGTDDPALAGIERALGEIREALGSLKPAEQFAGYDEAIRNLGAKLDLILRANDDPSTVHQLEGAIAALRSIVSNVASNDALARLSDDVRLLSSRVDQLSRAGEGSDSFAILEQRIAALSAALESRERPAATEGTEHLEGALRALSDRLDRMPVGNDSASAFAHLEQRVSYLLERLEASSDHSSGNLGRVEDGLQEILRHLESQRASFATLAESARNAPPRDSTSQDPELAEIIKRELTDIRFGQTERDRHTQDSLEAVHNTLGHVVDRLAMIEGELRTARPAPVAPLPMAPSEPRPATPLAGPPASPEPLATPPQIKPELPNPAADDAHFDAAPREFHAAPPLAPAAIASIAPRAISEILEPYTAPAHATIEPDLPPDHPLEPGTRPNGRAASPSERIAASENAISEIPAPKPEPATASSFIAAARRAAQAAAAAQQPTGKPAKPAKAAKAPRVQANASAAAPGDKEPSTITSKIRSLLVGASVVVIVLGTFKMAMTLLDGGSLLQLSA